MALVVENPAALLTPKSRSYGRWNYAELDADYPELVTGVRQLLEIDESKSSCDANESVRAGRMYATPRKLVESVMCRSQNEESPTSVGFSKGKTQYVDRKPQLSSATRSSVSFCRTSIDVDHSHTQQMFCHKLEELIQWLYKLSDVAETWVPPKPDVKSIQSALHLYLKFKKDVSGQQVVAENVIKLGEILLNCIASNSPVLKDAIALISKKSEELESHGERLYASVLGAMDLITDSNLRMNEDTQHVVS